MRQHVFQPCISTRATKAPAGPDWLHEIKHDGYRLIVQRVGDRVRPPHLSKHDIAEIDAEIRAVLTEFGEGQ